MAILCPFCLKEHSGDNCKLPGRDTQYISQSYIKKVQKGVPVYPIVVIGYSGCGKTAFLNSFVYSLFESHFFHVEPLDQGTLNKIREEDHGYYHTFVDQKRFLPLTSSAKVFEEPLLLELHVKRKKNILGMSRSKEAILVMYDVSGETYMKIDYIVEKLPIIAQIPNLIILIDLHSMYIKYKDRTKVELQSLITTVKRALDQLSSPMKKKNAIICFTKSDECWGKKDDYGPLSERDELPEDYEDYIRMMKVKSTKIEEYISKDSSRRRYGDFHQSITHDFGGWFFTDVSSVGGKVNHETNTFEALTPYRVIDPILWLLNH